MTDAQQCRVCGEDFPYTPDADICPVCVAEEMERVVPCEDDDFIDVGQSQGTVVSHAGRYLGCFPTDRRAEAALYVARAKSRFWPNIWQVNDHGNMTLMVFDSHVLRATDTSYV